MKKNSFIILSLVLCMMAIETGCNKKVTKVEPAAQPPAAKQEPVAKTEHVQTDNDVFQPVDMDAKMKEVFQTVYFDYDKSDLRPDAIERLEKIAGFLAENATVRVLVEGHADERGSNEYNIGLGESRAKAAKEYLISYGVKPTRLEHTSYGRERPAFPNCQDEDCHGKNRRVEWKILAK
jgi:peptidoglycan-associated lipoprotein